MAIHNKALLVSLSIGLPPQSRALKHEAESLEIKHRTEPNQTQVVSKLFAKQDIRGLQRAASNARAWFRLKTLPFGRSQGIIPAKRYFDFLQELGELRLAFEDEKKSLLDNIEDVLRNAQLANGTLFDRANYPSLAELEGSIYFTISCNPVPASNDYDKLADLTPEELEILKSEAVLTNQNRMESAIKDLFGRLLKGLEHAAERLTDDDEGSKIFHKTLVTNIHKAIEAAETLNIEDDENIKAMTESVKDIFDGITADDLRRDADLRKETAKKATELADKMSEFF